MLFLNVYFVGVVVLILSDLLVFIVGFGILELFWCHEVLRETRYHFIIHNLKIRKNHFHFITYIHGKTYQSYHMIYPIVLLHLFKAFLILMVFILFFWLGLHFYHVMDIYKWRLWWDLSKIIKGEIYNE